eukprot:m.23103 g.23103  ORF g.23103 m.23103 type:complete len:514 (+) comp7466_c0_seq3:18-1559(+)
MALHKMAALLMVSTMLAVEINAAPIVGNSTPSTANCKKFYYTQTSDHFSWTNGTEPQTFQERYFICDEFWDGKDGPIWFYCGNEANVELYVNNTGLMWDNAKDAKALLVFAEHRYYGESLIYPGDQTKLTTAQYRLLTMEQALADYAQILSFIRPQYNNVPAVGFGGSYGGMLAAWLRMKYPSAIVGAIAASAPILAFGKEWDTNRYWQVVTRDATPAAGAKEGCDSAVRSAWPMIFSKGATAAGMSELQETFHICPSTPIKTTNDVHNLAFMLLNVWDTLAMGNFPFASNYMVFQQTGDPGITLPPYPFRVACDLMMGGSPPSGDKVLSNFADAIGVLYNVTKNENCYEIPSDPNYDGIWDWQYCTELLPQETYFSLNGTTDMFWARPFSLNAINQHCQQKYGITPKQEWIPLEFGGMAGVNQSSNIVFSSGTYDPWSSGGVGVDAAAASNDHVASFGVDGTVKAVVIDGGAHHLDLMFATKSDPPAVLSARKLELQQIDMWVKQAREASKN